MDDRQEDSVRAVLEQEHGSADVLRVSEVAKPQAGPEQIVLRVEAAGLNRADSLQRRGLYPPPPGAGPIYGLEAAGTVIQVGAGLPKSLLGQRRMALLSAGGYADYVAVALSHTLPVPAQLSFLEAAGIMEVAATVYSNLVLTCGLDIQTRGASTLTALIHGGTGGVGLHAIDLLKHLGLKIFATASSPEKCAYLSSLGVQAINYSSTDFADFIAEQAPAGLNYILDPVGAAYLPRHLDIMAEDAHLAIIGLIGGAKAEVNLAQMLSKRLSIHATSLRSRSSQEKTRIVAGLGKDIWPLLAAGIIKPHLDKVFKLEDLEAAHRYFDSGSHRGKVVLALGPAAEEGQ